MASEGVSVKTKRWAFTLNNPGEWRPVFVEARMDYLVYQDEIGENGTLHVQGYVRLKSRALMKTVKKLLDNNGVHLAPARGSEKENRDYCTKEDTRVVGPWEFGTYDASVGPGQGHRTDLDIATAAIIAGTSVAAVAREHPTVFVRYHQGMFQLAEIVQPPPPLERAVRATLLWGPTAVGKSHRAFHQYPQAYLVESGRDPWGRYQNQETIVMDEWVPQSSGGLQPLSTSPWTLPVMNRILDKWPYPLNCRYRDRQAMWTRVIILTNLPPQTIYAEYPDVQRDAFFRRLLIIEVTSIEQEIIIP